MLRNIVLSLLLAIVFSQCIWAESPNVVLIYVDDLGYGDLGCYGEKRWKTPNLDRLAKEGVRFTDFYVAQPVCSASRAALLTGCYPNRIGIHGALGPNARHGISDNEMTLAEICQQKGYKTAAIGKWHLGHHPPFLPTKHGFDQFFGLPYSNDMWPEHPEAKTGTYPPLPLLENDKIIDPQVSPAAQSKLTQQYTDKALRFVNTNKNNPFFLYIAHTFPHVPLFVGDKFRGSSEQGMYGDVIQEIDDSVGQILNLLKLNNLEENTLVIFASDNGPWLSYGNHAGTAGPLREGKGTVWDGGVRVPMIARWKGVIPAGAVQNEPAMTIDLLPTVARLIGAKLPEHNIDGKDIWPLLKGEKGAKSPHEAYYFYYNTNELQAIRCGKWKMILPHTYRTMEGQTPGKDGKPGKYKQVKVTQQLFDLSVDIGEKNDVAALNPEVVERILGYVEKARNDLGDSLTQRKGSGTRLPGRIE